MYTLATRAVERFGLDTARVRLLLRGHNTTYEVRASDGRRFALRLTRPGPSRAHIQAELDWIHAIAADTNLRVCVPHAGPQGEIVELDGRLCVMTAWVEGLQRRAPPSPREMRALGRATAELHEQASGWTPPPDWTRPRLDDPWAHHASPLPLLPPDDADLFAACAERLRPLLAQLHREETHVQHADLHSGNLRFQRGGGIGIIDFDDCAIGHPAQDLATTFFYLLLHEGAEQRLSDLQAGYEELRPWPADPELIEALVVNRALNLCAGLLAHPDLTLRTYLSRVLPRWTRLASNWLGRAGG